MQRIELSGWEFKQEGGAHDWMGAVVPGCVHTDLLRQDLISDPFYGRNELDLLWIEKCDWRYRSVFVLDKFHLEHDRLELVCEGLDTFATVMLNGETVATTDNMFVGWRFDVRRYVRHGSNVLEIIFGNPWDAIRRRNPTPSPVIGDKIGGRTEVRKQQCSFGWDWGPRLATCGIWRPIYIHAWSGSRIRDYLITQVHSNRQCRLSILVETEDAAHGGQREEQTIVASLSGNGRLIAHAKAKPGEPVEILVNNPELWQPNGYGDQPLYDLEIELLVADVLLDQRSQRLALCEINLVREPDQWGESFRFEVNGRAIFAKGANWIPAHSFVNEGQALIPDLLDSAVATHMNMLRVWGGGIYETEAFYEGCLERGLMVWQDFMFACATYPGDDAFCDQVRAEATYQVKRLRNYPHIALWCGNNEIAELNRELLNSDSEAAKAYKRVFLSILPEALERNLPGADYIHGSEFNPHDLFGNTKNEDSGDAHFWGVWHARQHFTAYEDQHHRFFSEFGMQAFPHVETARTFTQSSNIFGPEMDNHQKNGGGNQIIFHYIAELYRFPRDYPATVYLSQIMQAFTLAFGIEHMRRSMPRTMGALYWQINDCWPVASWSSIDFGGRWKALHYAAKRFFAPALVSVQWVGREIIHPSTNSVIGGVDGVEIYTVFDGPLPATGHLQWQLWSIRENRVILEDSTAVALEPGSSVLRRTLDLDQPIKSHGRNDLIIRTRLSVDGQEDNVNTTCLTAPKRLEFQHPNIEPHVDEAAGDGFAVTLKSDKVAYRVYLNLKDAIPHRLSDNFFDLFPGETKQVILQPLGPMRLDELRQALTIYSYRDSYLD